MSQTIQVFNQQPGMPPQPPAAPVEWMQTPPAMPNCPRGLEYLTQVDKIVIQQKKSILEAVTNWDVKNSYVLMNSIGEQVYYALEESDCCTRQCCAQDRDFTMHITDHFQNEVLTIKRPFKCCIYSCFAGLKICGHEAWIELSTREKIRNVDGQPCGAIRKKWGGLVKETLTQADTFSVEFPIDLDVKCKAALLGATFLIDFLQFEEKSGNAQNSSSIVCCDGMDFCLSSDCCCD
ncbi:unnamed protein product, partial [Mesorhabditis belari]|uniref:Phospholipid scramblase n=1 Tax=Mesorhabditis belari TaxID=2138241 RepID=A0AAF3ELR2_9BILA